MKTINVSEQLWAKLTHMKLIEKQPSISATVEFLYDEYVKEGNK